MFKLVGPVLVKQDQNEAKQNVNTRLEFIQGEMYVLFLFLFLFLHLFISTLCNFHAMRAIDTDGPRLL